MMKKNAISIRLIIAVMITILFAACTRKEKETVKVVKKYENGSRMLEEKHLGTGKNKRLVERVYYDKEGRRINVNRHEGEVITHIRYYENGAKAAEFITKNRKKEGPWNEWFRDGTIKSERFFVNNKPHGKFYWNFPSGGKQEGQWDNGKQVGTWTQWWDETTKMEVKSFQNGVSTGKWVRWYSNGQMELEALYVEGRLHGKYTEWHKNGTKKIAGTYHHGKFKGKWTKWDSEGKVLKVKYYEETFDHK